ncbi:MAG TPA: hypothetical protein VIL86_06050 [Tepidisphaeraceae bacterium]|jgi:hypothetical protein
MSEFSFVKPQRLHLQSHPVLDEQWIMDRIIDDPAIVGLGNLVLADKPQRRGEHLEFILEDLHSPARYEIVLKLGAATDGQIMRALECLAVRREDAPADDHCAVVIAENFAGRQVTLLARLGETVPLMGVQLGALKIEGQVTLLCSTIIERSAGRARAGEADDAAGQGKSPPPVTSAGLAASAEHAGPAGGEAGEDHESHDTAPRSAPAPAQAPGPVGANPWSDDHSRPNVKPVFAEAPVRERDARPKLHSPEHYDDVFAAALGMDPMSTFDARARARARAMVRPEARIGEALSPLNERRRLPSPKPFKRRPIFGFFCLVSLLIALATAAAWVRSYSVADTRAFVRDNQSQVMISDKGMLSWVQYTSLAPHDEDRQRQIAIPYWLPLSIFSILPAAWTIRWASR